MSARLGIMRVYLDGVPEVRVQGRGEVDRVILDIDQEIQVIATPDALRATLTAALAALDELESGG